MKRNKSHHKRRPANLTIITLVDDETGELWAKFAINEVQFNQISILGKSKGLDMKTNDDYALIIKQLLVNEVERHEREDNTVQEASDS